MAKVNQEETKKSKTGTTAVQKTTTSRAKTSAQKTTTSRAKTTAQRDLGKTVKEYLDKGVEVSKKGLKTAGAALSEFGDKSVIHLDILKFKSQLEKKYQELGKVVADQFSSGCKGSKKVVSITKSTPVVSEKLAKISELKNKIHEREEEIKQYNKKK